MKKILIVDQDVDTISMLSDSLIPYDIFRIISAENARQAAELLEQSRFDLVITELYLPEINGLKLLLYLKKKFPKTRAIAMLKSHKPEIISRLDKMAVQYYFIKPLDTAHILDAIFDELNIVPAGKIHGISLASLLQLVDIEKKTCTLTITCSGKTGLVHCMDGEVIAAETGSLTGKKALYHIMFWKKTIIEIEEECRKTHRDIKIPLMYLLMESHKIEDENKDNNQQKTVKDLPGESDDYDLKTIRSILDNSSEIYEYGIFDSHGNIQYIKNESGLLSTLNPVIYINIAADLGNILDNHLNRIVIHTSNRVKYSLFTYHNRFIIVKMIPGCKSMDFINKFKLQAEGHNG